MATELDEKRMIRPLPDGCVELERIEIIKYLDADGNPVLIHQASESLRTWEAIGMCVFTTDTLRRALLEEDA